MESIDREIDRLLAKLAEERRARGEALDSTTHPGEDTGSVGQLGLRSPACRRFADDARVLDLIGDILQPGISIFSVKMIAKPPFTDMPCHWHQDDAYYLKAPASKTRMAVWVPLQDAPNRTGACTSYQRATRGGLKDTTRRTTGSAGSH